MKTKWIDVDKKLPDEDIECLTTHSYYKCIHRAIYLSDHKIFILHDPNKYENIVLNVESYLPVSSIPWYSKKETEE